MVDAAELNESDFSQGIQIITNHQRTDQLQLDTIGYGFRGGTALTRDLDAELIGGRGLRTAYRKDLAEQRDISLRSSPAHPEQSDPRKLR